MNIDANKSSQRSMLGVVTSGVNRGPKGSGRNGKRGHKLYLPQRQAIALIGSHACSELQANSSNNKQVMVLFQNPGGRYLRPAFLYLM